VKNQQKGKHSNILRITIATIAVFVLGFFLLEAYSRHLVRKAGGPEAYARYLIAKGHVESAEITVLPLLLTTLPPNEAGNAKLALTNLRIKANHLTEHDVKKLDAACSGFITSLNQIDRTKCADNGREFVKQCNAISEQYK
jgi:hypothetical protein